MPDSVSEFPDKLRAAGVVGAGGAGFPSYVKAKGKAEFVLVNAAECEPLLKKDQSILARWPNRVFDGLEMFMRASGASRGILCIKRKHGNIIPALEKLAASRRGVSVCKLGDFYPAGDEQCIVYEATGRIVPPGGIPLDVGCIVSNVETFYNAAFAPSPVVKTFITVNGAVKRPSTFLAPVGISWREAVELCGGFTVKDPVFIDGGPMMGKVAFDFDAPVVKASSGIIVLPKDHPLIHKKNRTRSVFARQGRSACDQCSFCTQFCPRYMLGHAVEPHRVMRNLLFSSPEDAELHSRYALLCVGCSLCTLYSCPEGLDPKETCAAAKNDLRALKITYANSQLNTGAPVRPHPLREYRKVPVPKLIRRLGLEDYDRPAPWLETEIRPRRVKIMMSQHIGAPCTPCVREGQRVACGDKVGEVPGEKLGCPVHSSIAGTVLKVNEKYVEIIS